MMVTSQKSLSTWVLVKFLSSRSITICSFVNKIFKPQRTTFKSTSETHKVLQDPFSGFEFSNLNLVKIGHLIAFCHRWFRKLSVLEIVLPLLSVGTMHLFLSRYTHANTEATICTIEKEMSFFTFTCKFRNHTWQDSVTGRSVFSKWKSLQHLNSRLSCLDPFHSPNKSSQNTAA